VLDHRTRSLFAVFTHHWYNLSSATLAQSAEQPLRKRQVLGSIPKGGSTAGPFNGALVIVSSFGTRPRDG
jgi:hypothetical protein